MTAPVLTPALVALRHAFDVASPDRDKESDGWIGDAAHQAEVSGHNPDDTPGVQAEYSDTDTIPEVRAIDVDDDLRASFNMQQVIDRILKTPDDLKRLRYIIYNRQIWRKSNGWVRQIYSGSDPHTSHAHLSGDPLYDNDSRPWPSVEGFGMTTQFNADDIAALRGAALAVLQYSGRGIGENGNDGNNQPLPTNKSVLAYLDEILDNTRAIKTMLENLPTTGGGSGPTVAEISKATVDEFKVRL